MPRFSQLARPNVAEIRPYREGKSAPGALKLSANENPLGPSPRAITAMQGLLPDLRLYPDPLCTQLSARLAKHVGVQPENIIVGRGSDEVIHMLGLAFLRPGDEVVFADPPFALYPFTAKLMDARAVPVPLRDHVHDLAAMANAITDRTRLIFVANPHNPTGTLVTRRQADAFVRALPGHVIVAWDAAYHEYVTEPDAPDPVAWVREGLPVIVLRTFSKVYALAGLRVGYGIACDDLINLLEQVREPFNVSSIGQVAAQASLADLDQVTRGRAINEQGKAYLYEHFGRLGLEFVPTQANFVFVNTGVDSVALYDELAQRGYTVRTGEIWGLDTWIRLTVGLPEQNEGFVTALEQALVHLGSAA